MLILTRKMGEKVIIDDRTTLEVLNIHHGTVRLGFTAPKEIEVFREEVYERIQQEKLDIRD